MRFSCVIFTARVRVLRRRCTPRAHFSCAVVGSSQRSGAANCALVLVEAAVARADVAAPAGGGGASAAGDAVLVGRRRLIADVDGYATL